MEQSPFYKANSSSVSHKSLSHIQSWIYFNLDK